MIEWRTGVCVCVCVCVSEWSENRCVCVTEWSENRCVCVCVCVKESGDGGVEKTLI